MTFATARAAMYFATEVKRVLVWIPHLAGRKALNQSSIALPARFGIPRDAVSCIRLILVAVAAVTFRVGQAPVTVSAVGALRPADAPDLLVPTMVPGISPSGDHR